MFGTFEDRFEISDREIDVLGIAGGIAALAVGARVEAGENRAVAVEVMAAGGDALAGDGEQGGVKVGGFFDVSDGQDDAVELGGHDGILLGGVDDETVVDEPLLGGGGIGGDEEDFLDGAGGGVLAFDAGGSWVLDFEAWGSFAAADFDAAGDDAGDVGAVFDDAVEDLVEAVDPAVLAFDTAELHEGTVIDRGMQPNATISSILLVCANFMA